MIVSQFQESRRFMGRLDAGQDLAAGFRTICKENGIASGWVQAVAVLKDPAVLPLHADGRGFQAAELIPGVVFFPALTGNLSLEGESLSVRLYGTGMVSNGGPPALGVVRGGEVVFCEFLLLALDDAVLVRASGPGGFAQWDQLQGGQDARIRAAAAAAAAAPRAPEGPAPRPAPAPLYVQPDEDESSELNVLDMAEGDYVDHPKFGQCRIVHAPLDEKVSIRLPTGKHVDLHLGVMRVLQPKQVGGRRVFQVEVRRKP
jgi:predicted DNA-binding protein with PD1-like motif